MHPAIDSVLGENDITRTTEVPAEAEASGSSTGELLPYEMSNYQETNTEQDNDASVTDMELDTVEKGLQSLAEQSANESSQQDSSCILTRYMRNIYVCRSIYIIHMHAS